MSYEPGMTYGGRYRLVSRIAVGGMGEVWRATDQVLGRTVAIKLLGAALAAQPGFAQRFREEARHTAQLGHQNIAQVHDYGEDSGASWLVMELVEGKPLSQILREDGVVSPERTVSIVAQAADALQAAHNHGVIHRDVKPANIMVRPDGVVKLTDFGIARAADAAPLTRTGEVMGTAQYISPEQAMGHPVGPTSDLYSLGCVAYEMLTGRRLFDEGSAVATAMAHVHKAPPTLPATVPTNIAAVIMGCLAKDPAHRPQTGKALSGALRGLPGATYPPTQAFTTGGAQATERLASPTGYAAGALAGYGAGAGYPGGGPSPTAAYQVPPPGPGGAKRNPAVWLVPLIILLAALLGFAIVQSGILGGSDEPSPLPTSTPPPTTTAQTTTTTTTTTSTTTTPTKVTIDEKDYVGRSVDEARTKLTRLGLLVKVKPEASDQAEGTVLGLVEYGDLLPGQTVTLKVSRGPDQPTSPSSSPTETTGSPDSPGTSAAPTSYGTGGQGGPQPAGHGHTDSNGHADDNGDGDGDSAGQQ